jgi:Cu(I)/Ag(I) efflux system protein CusF
MKSLMRKIVTVAGLAFAGAALAVSHLNPVSGYTDGEVRKVDKEAGKVTLKHGPIANLEMPPMTMVFRVKEPAMLERMKQGDKVKFKAEKVQGAYTVTELAPAKP